MALPEWKPSAEHFQFIQNVLFTHDVETNLDYYFRKAGDTLILVFQGSCQDEDWRSDFDYYATPIEFFPGSAIKGHGGIYRQYLAVRNEFLNAGYDPEVENIFIAGYSLGGGLTQLAVEDAAYHFPGKTVSGISYEGPRVFCKNKEVKKIIGDKCILVKNFWDPVVHLPFKTMVAPFFKFYIFPFSLKFSRFLISRWEDYGKKCWIGKILRISPLQHESSEISRALLEKFGE